MTTNSKSPIDPAHTPALPQHQPHDKLHNIQQMPKGDDTLTPRHEQLTASEVKLSLSITERRHNCQGSRYTMKP